jgi:hypothetical protein
VAGGGQVRTRDVDAAGAGSVWAATVSPDGELIAIGDHGGGIGLWTVCKVLPAPGTAPTKYILPPLPSAAAAAGSQAAPPAPNPPKTESDDEDYFGLGPEKKYLERLHSLGEMASCHAPWPGAAFNRTAARPALATLASVGYRPVSRLGSCRRPGCRRGAGWSFGATDQLVSIPYDPVTNPQAGMLRVFGSGEYRFNAGTSTVSTPANDDGVLTLSGGVYTYTTPDGRTEAFNSADYEAQWTSADGHPTLQYRNNGSNPLTGATAIDGGLRTFSYSSGFLTATQTVNGRTATRKRECGRGAMRRTPRRRESPPRGLLPDPAGGAVCLSFLVPPAACVDGWSPVFSLFSLSSR